MFLPVCFLFFYQMTQTTDVKAQLEKELLDVCLKKDCSCLCLNNDVSPVLRQVLHNISQKGNLVKLLIVKKQKTKNKTVPFTLSYYMKYSSHLCLHFLDCIIKP